MHNRKTRITGLDVVVTVLLLALAAFIVYRLVVKLNYKWNWAIIPQYLMFFDEAEGRWKANVLLQGLFTTIRLSVWATLMATVFGLVAGVLRTTPRLFNRLVGRAYVELIRNVPPLVLIFIFYFFVSSQILPLLGVESFIRSRGPGTQKFLGLLFSTPDLFTAFISGVVTVAVFQGAYIAEIVRSGIQSIEKGQWEASYALGLSWWQQMRDIVMPQAFKRVLPPLANEFINTIKYSAIVSIISIQELTFQGMQVMAATHVTIEVWLTITAIYLIMCLTLSFGVQWLEAKMARKDF
ncbi:MAG: amino acid ABC transporter permease [Deltaproteobacteria bacterium]|nr:MAG: amino acid ABC transporter permease [Deltaproteobacteria bacterium]